MNIVHKGLALSALAGVFAVGSGAMAASVISSPVQVPWKSGNAAVECQEAFEKTGGVSYQYSYKIDNWNGAIGGDYLVTFDGQTAMITISKNDGTYFNWSATHSMGAVIVKGGTAANVFKYGPQADSDARMVSPNTASGKPAAVSHATFCWNSDTSLPQPDPVADRDGDGLIDELDAFPLNPERAAQRFYPNGSDYGYLAFEDNWPSKGDFDMNDLVVAYRAIETLNARNEVTDLRLVYELIARGGTAQIGFGVHLPGIAANQIKAGLTTLKIGNQAPVALPVESGQSEAVFILSPKVNDLTQTGLSWPCSFFNTVNNCARRASVLLVADIHFQQPLSPGQLDAAPYNPFIYRTNRGREVHLVDHPPTAKADPRLFGTGDDRSNPAQGRYYRTADNQPWALDVPETWRYTAEWNNVANAYPDFAVWAGSGGVTAPDWYVSNVNDKLVFQP